MEHGGQTFEQSGGPTMSGERAYHSLQGKLSTNRPEIPLLQTAAE